MRSRPDGPTRVPADEHTRPDADFDAKWLDWIRSVQRDAQHPWDAGRMYHVVQLNLGGTTAGWASTTAVGGEDVPGAIEAIERIGWRLHNAGYVYQPTKQRSNIVTDSGHMEGRIIGVFTFRRPDDVPVPQVPGP